MENQERKFILNEQKQIETLARITDDEAEFWTNLTPNSKDKFEINLGNKSDGLYFRFHNEINEENQNNLLLLYENNLQSQVNQIEKQIERKSITDLFKNNDQSPGITKKFLDQLNSLEIGQFSQKYSNDNDDEDFLIIDDNEINSISNENHLTTENENLFEKIRSFFIDLTDETNVIRGSIDQETLINRRSRRAKSSISLIQHQNLLNRQTSI